MKDIDYDYFYDTEGDLKYCYPGGNVLINKLGIREIKRLHKAERDISSIRQSELELHPIKGKYDLKHICKIHKYLFQDIYEWAGKPRTVDIAKGTIFCLAQFISKQFADLNAQLISENYLKDISDPDVMSKRLAYYLGEINMIHPFREGNGRTQRLFISQLCREGKVFELDFTDVTAEEMAEASIMSANVSNEGLEKLIRKCIYFTHS